jgi:hypothetical protein
MIIPGNVRLSGRILCLTFDKQLANWSETVQYRTVSVAQVRNYDSPLQFPAVSPDMKESANLLHESLKEIRDLKTVLDEHNIVPDIDPDVILKIHAAEGPRPGPNANVGASGC